MSLKHWINKNYKNIIIAAFIIPIITVALVSISHVMHWYAISNTASWAVYFSVGIEIAAMSALAAIAARMGKKVYFPFIIVTLIQFIGNIYFSYAFIDVTSAAFTSWKELVSPILQLTGVEATDLMAHKRFLAFFAGGLLPIISLSFLHMLIRFTEEDRLRDTAKELNATLVNEPLVTVSIEAPIPEEVPIILNETKEEQNEISEINDIPVETMEKKTEVVTEPQEIEIPREVIEDATRVKLNEYELEMLENKLNAMPYVEKQVPNDTPDIEAVNDEIDEESRDDIQNHLWELDEKEALIPEAEEVVSTEPEIVSTEPEPTYEQEKDAFLALSHQTMADLIEKEQKYIADTEPTYIAGIDPITEEPEITIMKVDPETQMQEQIIPKIKEVDEDLKKKA